MTVPILYEDEALVVSIKPDGILSEDVPGGLIPLLRSQLGLTELYCAHRLDREVGGVIAAAKTKAACAVLTAAFTDGTADKRYLAVCSGCPEPAEGLMEDLLYHDPNRNKTFPVRSERKGVKAAKLAYRVLETVSCDTSSPVPLLSLCEVRPFTGRTHQIRVQFASRKHPLFGDRKYGSAFTGPCALFCRSLSLPHPVTGLSCSFRAQPGGEPWSAFRISGDA